MIDSANVQLHPGNTLRSLSKLLCELNPIAKLFSKKRFSVSLHERQGVLDQPQPETPEYQDHRFAMVDW